MNAQYFARLQIILPHRLIGRICHFFTHRQIPWLSHFINRCYSAYYQLDLTEAEHPRPQDYPNLAKLFTRALKPGARPVAAAPHILTSPADGKISAYGNISSETRLTIKGQIYTINDLLAHHSPEKFAHYAVIYLAPHNYHRVHMPLDATLTAIRHVPGRSFSVNPPSQRHVSQLFARNERVITQFDTAHGPMAMIWVGAMIVGGITVHPKGLIAPQNLGNITHLDTTPTALNKGAELGYFTFGSSIILLFNGELQWQTTCGDDKEIKYGQALAQFATPSENRHTNPF